MLVIGQTHHCQKEMRKTTEINQRRQLLGDSVVKGFHANGISKATGENVVAKSFSGATAEDMKYYLKPNLKRKPSNVIIHVVTNKLKTDEAQVIVNEVKDICELVKDSSPETNITVSEIITREDYQLIKAKIKEVDNGLSRYFQQNSWCF